MPTDAGQEIDDLVLENQIPLKKDQPKEEHKERWSQDFELD